MYTMKRLKDSEIQNLVENAEVDEAISSRLGRVAEEEVKRPKPVNGGNADAGAPTDKNCWNEHLESVPRGSGTTAYLPLANLCPGECAEPQLLLPLKCQLKEDVESQRDTPKVLPWGGEWTTNTCPIDNFLSIIWARDQQDPDFRHKIGKTEDERLLAEILGKFDEHKFDEGKLIWANNVMGLDPRKRPSRNKRIDLHGREQERFISHFDGSTLAIETHRACPSCGHFTSIKTSIQYLDFQLTPSCSKDDVQLLIHQMLKGRKLMNVENIWKNCPATESINELPAETDLNNNNRKNRQRGVEGGCSELNCLSGRHLRSESPWMVALEVKTLECIRLTVDSLPLRLEMDEVEMSLAGITLHSETRNHFTAIIRYRQTMFYYDAESPSLLTPLKQSVLIELAHQNYKPNFAVYLIDNDPDPVRSLKNLFSFVSSP